MNLDQFWALVERPDDPDACWTWHGTRDHKGYGVLHLNSLPKGVSSRSHRLSYELLVGPIAEELEIDHLCRNTSCANPAHLEPVTHLENNLRRSRTVTHCPRGHAYDDANTWIWRRRATGRTYRICKTCRLDKQRARRLLARSSSTKGIQ